MHLQLIFSVGLIVIGLVFAARRQELCQHKCWLDKAVDLLLPDALDAFSGGVPFVLLGIVLLIHTFLRR